jgi:tetratricopeptide (TPR) repeat protein
MAGVYLCLQHQGISADERLAARERSMLLRHELTDELRECVQKSRRRRIQQMRQQIFARQGPEDTVKEASDKNERAAHQLGNLQHQQQCRHQQPLLLQSALKSFTTAVRIARVRAPPPPVDSISHGQPVTDNVAADMVHALYNRGAVYVGLRALRSAADDFEAAAAAAAAAIAAAQTGGSELDAGRDRVSKGTPDALVGKRAKALLGLGWVLEQQYQQNQHPDQLEHEGPNQDEIVGEEEEEEEEEPEGTRNEGDQQRQRHQRRQRPATASTARSVSRSRLPKESGSHNADTDDGAGGGCPPPPSSTYQSDSGNDKQGADACLSRAAATYASVIDLLNPSASVAAEDGRDVVTDGNRETPGLAPGIEGESPPSLGLPLAIAARESVALLRQSWFNRGNALRQAGLLLEAERCYSAVLRIPPPAVRSLGPAGAGAAVSDQGHVMSMDIEDFASVGQIVADDGMHLPDPVEALCNRGGIFHSLGLHSKALADYDSALSMQPRHRQALLNRAQVR